MKSKGKVNDEMTKVLSPHHLFQLSVPMGSALIYEQLEGLGLGGLQLLLLWQNYGFKVW